VIVFNNWPGSEEFEIRNSKSEIAGLSDLGFRTSDFGFPTMIDLHRILVPTDFSEYSKTAVTYAAAFAEKFGAELHLLHVVQNLALIIPDILPVEPSLVPSLEQMTEAVHTAFDRMIAENKLQPYAIHRAVREGTPFFEIIQYAREAKIDLIIMGTHGHSGLAHVLLGSVTEKVVRKSPCPVLTVRHPEHEFVHP
jgi:nucleotide-binding universal stress UspA family protein